VVNSSENLEEAISTMTTTVAGNPEYVPWLHELLFSIYCSFLFVWGKESRPFAWPTRYLYFWHPHAVSLGRVDFLLFYLELFMILTAAIFLCLRLTRRFSLTQVLLRPIAGAIALTGFPLVCLYRQNRLSFFLGVELALTAVCFLLWMYRRWPVSAPLNVVLLILHYALWSLFSGAAHVASSPWAWGIWDYAWFVYPALGLAYTLVWAAYFRHSGSTEHLGSPTTAE
jgi:hypothetical protein